MGHQLDTPGQAGFIYFTNIYYCSLQPDQPLPAGHHHHPRHTGDDHYILAMEMFSTTTLVVQMTATTPLTMSLVSMLCLCLAMPLYAVL